MTEKDRLRNLARLQNLALSWFRVYLSACHDDDGWERWQHSYVRHDGTIDFDLIASQLKEIEGEGEWTAGMAQEWWEEEIA